MKNFTKQFNYCFNALHRPRTLEAFMEADVMQNYISRVSQDQTEKKQGPKLIPFEELSDRERETTHQILGGLFLLMSLSTLQDQ